MKKSKVRIKDIAELAQVSKGTVDRVLHNRGDVSPDAKIRVLDAIKKLDYKPNKIASILASNRNYKIATFLPDPKEDEFWVQPNDGILHSAETIRDYNVFVDIFHFPDGRPLEFITQAKKILDAGYDGLLFSPSYTKESMEIMDICAEKKVPFLLINSFIQTQNPMFVSYIGQDSYGSGVLAAKLLDFGMQKNEKALILHLENEVLNAVHLMSKEKGFRDYFINHHGSDNNIIQASCGEFDNKILIEKTLKKVCKSHPDITGIFVTTSKVNKVISILEEIDCLLKTKVVGFDLIESNLHFLELEKVDFLINQNAYKQGSLGLMTLFNKIVMKKDAKKIQYLPLDVVMKENVKYYLQKELEMVSL